MTARPAIARPGTARPGTAGPGTAGPGTAHPRTARPAAVSDTVSPPGTSRTRRLTRTTAWTGEQAHITSSAPFAAAISAARDGGSPCPGVSAASTAMSAAVCTAARAPTSAPTFTATTPVIRTSPDNANPTRVAPPCCAAGHSSDLTAAARVRVGQAASVAAVLTGLPGSVAGQARGRPPPWR
jgi:hypothetical protein